ncbi:AraC family transcriptional regulator [Mesorhizobium sp. DCY119]|uniref:helix-turn-helix transcriptional regulator n=1 Tax=Mesorhizobium sp. DCY119 TaxID=2108445 RepID=UPI000E6B8652|nr:AraC family transcriptional regulator [Mesorhizobium sp. DCY119]RJG44858.1 AraC family transcriptional regulator [Mesorhizobium sp. DCY119]
MSSFSGVRDDSFDPGGNKRVLVRDFMRRDGVVVDSTDDRLSMEDTLIEGEFLHQELRRGLVLHISDAIEERPFTITSRQRQELSCIFFLDGEVDLKIGDRRFQFKGDQRSAIKGAAIMSTGSESFERASMGGQHVRHLVVSATPDWLNFEGLEEVRDNRLAASLLKDNLADHRWTLTPRVVELVRQIVTPSVFLPELRNLYLEGRAVELVAETIMAVMHTDRRATGSNILQRHEMTRLRRAKDLIAANLAEPLNVEMIARESGISASGLQRLFRRSEGHSVFEYVRRLRLELAFAALQDGETSIQDASAIAGYSSPANFATAFKRQFGVTPREVLTAR